MDPSTGQPLLDASVTTAAAAVAIVAHGPDSPTYSDVDSDPGAPTNLDEDPVEDAAHSDNPPEEADVARRGEICDPVSGCSGGQNCIVMRRIVGDIVIEDRVLTAAGLPVRISCSSAYTTRQEEALTAYFDSLAAAGINSLSIGDGGGPEPLTPLMPASGNE